MSDKEFFDRAIIAFSAAYSSQVDQRGDSMWSKTGIINEASAMATALLEERKKALEELKLND